MASIPAVTESDASQSVHPNVSAEEATKEFSKYLVEIDCQDEGRYQGIVTEVTPADNQACTWGKIKLERPSRDGVPLGDKNGTAILIPGELIKEIKVLQMPKQGEPAALQNGTKVTAPHSLQKSSQQVQGKGISLKQNRYGQLPAPLMMPSNVLASQYKVLSREKKVLRITPPNPDGSKETPEKSSGKKSVSDEKGKKPEKGKIDKKPREKPEQSSSSMNKSGQVVKSKQQSISQEGRLHQSFKQNKVDTSVDPITASKSATLIKKSNRIIYNSALHTKNKNAIVKQDKRETVVQSVVEAQQRPVSSPSVSRRPSVAQSLMRASAEPFVPRTQLQTTDIGRNKKILTITPPPALPEEEKLEGIEENCPTKKDEEDKPKEDGAERKEKIAKVKPKKMQQQSTGQKEFRQTKAEGTGKGKDERNRLEKEKRAEKWEKKKGKGRKADEIVVEAEAQKGEEETQQKEVEISSTQSRECMKKDDDSGIIEETIATNESIEKTVESMSKLEIGQPEMEETEMAGKESPTAEEGAKMDPSQFVGTLASIDCTNGVYQGVISHVDPVERTIQLDKPMLDGVPLSEPKILLAVEAMKKLKVFCNDNQKSREDDPIERVPSATRGTIYMQSLPDPSMAIQHQRPMKLHYGSASPDFHRPQSMKNQYVRRASSSPKPLTPPAKQLAHERYGDYKKFIEPQVPTPVRLQINARPNPHQLNNYGPTGNPAMDCINGYRGYNDNLDSSDAMGDPLDHNTLNTDFDFAGNLALFDKKEFNRQTEGAFHGLDTSCKNSRNYRNDENVLMDSSRVISWTKPRGTNVGGFNKYSHGKLGSGYNTPPPKSGT